MVNFKIQAGKKIDTSKLEKMMKANANILFGIPDGISASNGESVSDIAMKNSYGAHGIPSRPFLEEGLLSEKEQLLKEIKEGFYTGKFEKIASIGVGAIQKFVRGSYYRSTKPNSSKTIQTKGSDTPLIDTGLMLNSVTYLIEGGK